MATAESHLDKMASGTELGLQTDSNSIFLPIAAKNTNKICLQRTKYSIGGTSYIQYEMFSIVL